MDFLGTDEVKVAIVDDSKDVRTTISRWINECEQCVICFEMTSGVGVTDKVKDLKPDLIFLDDAMPFKGGFDVINELNCIPDDERPYIVMMSEITLDYISRMAIERGANDFIYKPFSKTNFLARMSLFCACYNLGYKESAYNIELPYKIIEDLRKITYELREKNNRISITTDVDKLLLEANFSSSHEGSMHIEYAIESIIFKYGHNYTLSKHIYPEVAGIAGISADSVEYAIRHAISEAWKKCLLYNEMEGTIFERYKKKPSNAELIKYIVNLIEKKYYEC